MSQNKEPRMIDNPHNTKLLLKFSSVKFIVSTKMMKIININHSKAEFNYK